MNTGKFIVGVFAGVAVGAALGVLFAPDKGSDTRRRIGRRGEDMAANLGEKFTDLIESMTEKFDSLKSEALHMAEKTEKKIKEEKSQFEAAVNK